MNDTCVAFILTHFEVNGGVLICAASNDATKREPDICNAALLRPQAAASGNARQVGTVRLNIQIISLLKGNFVSYLTFLSY